MAAALLIAAGGCAPRDLAGGVLWTARRERMCNAAFLAVSDMPGVRLNAELLDALKRVQEQTDPAKGRAMLAAVVSEARRLGEYADNNEIDRLDDDALRFIWRRWAGRERAPADLRAAVRDRFWSEANDALAAFTRELDRAADADSVHRLARRIEATVERSPKDRHGGGPMLALVAAAIDEERGPPDRGGPCVDVYEPALDLTCAGRRSPPDDRATDVLLAALAPVIVQERIDPAAGGRASACPSCAGAALAGGDARPQAPYDPDIDRIGTVRLAGAGDEVCIDTEQPSVYAHARHTWVRGRRLVQLTYTYWFPAHPKLKRFDPEEGRIEGAVLRITLDPTGRPMLFETVLCCGCYHRCYPADYVERAACARYGRPEKGKTWCVERDVPGRMDWIVPETVEVVSAHPGHPILFSRAGYHGPAGITFDSSVLESRTVLQRRGYALRCYDELEQLPIGGEDRSAVRPARFSSSEPRASARADSPIADRPLNGLGESMHAARGFREASGGSRRVGSMFQANGLVRGAERLEGKLLAGTGMLSAGQPRQRGTQLLHWDQYDFDDPHLLERCLRLPEGF
ncbi:MAG: hypothetical protein C4547_02875 [Phycisphaerales bacterium]|nr:MAG: hypothetical protein C4547_02875 [Phycisphaerales bacterium]